MKINGEKKTYKFEIWKVSGLNKYYANFHFSSLYLRQSSCSYSIFKIVPSTVFFFYSSTNCPYTLAVFSQVASFPFAARCALAMQKILEKFEQSIFEILTKAHDHTARRGEVHPARSCTASSCDAAQSW